MNDHSQSEPSLGDSLPGSKRVRRRGWIWFFLVLVVLTVIAITVLVGYKRSFQLTAEKLAEARALWKVNGPADYDLDYEIKKLDGKETYTVQVRVGKAVSATCNGQPLDERL